MTGRTAALALMLIRVYQTGVSPALGVRCRFEPSCSAYTYQAIARFGLIRGISLGTRRLVRCRPGGAGGYDPVPPEAPSGAHAADRVERTHHVA